MEQLKIGTYPTNKGGAVLQDIVLTINKLIEKVDTSEDITGIKILTEEEELIFDDYKDNVLYIVI